MHDTHIQTADTAADGRKCGQMTSMLLHGRLARLSSAPSLRLFSDCLMSLSHCSLRFVANCTCCAFAGSANARLRHAAPGDLPAIVSCSPDSSLNVAYCDAV